ncbi:MAG: hypothetical protein Q9216_000525 [Gyalolechia sp. 2 TL-2023]
MFVRPSRLKLNHDARQQLRLSPTDLYLPWLCPALYSEQPKHRVHSTLTPPRSLKRSNPAFPTPKPSSPFARTESRGLASVTSSDFLSPPSDYIPFEDQDTHGQPPKLSSFRWTEAAESAQSDRFATGMPLIIRDSLATRHSKFRSVDAITGAPQDIISTMKACLHVGRFDRATALMQRLNALYKPDAPALLAAHNEYIREIAWKIVASRDQHLLDNLQKWFEVELRGRGVIPDATSYASMMQAALQDISVSRSNRSLRRYMHLADEAGLRDELMNALFAVLNEQDFGRVTRITTSRPISITSITAAPSPTNDSAPQPAPSNKPPSELPEIRPVDRELPGLRALKQSLSVFSDPSAIASPDAIDGTPEENVKRRDIERQLRMEQDTYESAIEKWRSDDEQRKHRGINSALAQNSFGTLMWDWHRALEPAIREEIKLANEAEGKDRKSPIDDERCQFGPFLQYLEPSKLSAITILTCMTLLGTTRKGDLGSPISAVVSSIGDAVQNESMAAHLKKTGGRPLKGLQRVSGIRGLAAELRKQRKGDYTRLNDLPNLPLQALQGHQWSEIVKAHIGAVLLSKLVESAKVRVFRRQSSTGETLEMLQPAFLHSFQYGKGRRVGMLSMNSAMYDRLAKEPIAASLEQKYLPMLVEPKPWTGFQEGGFLTCSQPLVRVQWSSEQSRNYCMVAAESGDMAQVCAGLDVLSKTPWQINGPVFEAMLEAWNTGEAIGSLAPDDPEMELPSEPAVQDKIAYAKYLRDVRQIRKQKRDYKSERCFQNFQLEIARAYLQETFYFPHNVDFRGRAYPMPPFLNYMGADLCRGLLTFGVGKQLGAGGLRWLKIHLANVFGYDKASFEERVSFAEDHLGEIYDSARKPMDGRRWWLQAEDPWQCLAACKELHNALESPDPQTFVSRLAIHQDGTCNGLQHYAALGGDSLGARQVNLEPGARPSDIYTAVAELVQADVAEDARQGDVVAKALVGRVSRKVVKQTVMTNVYGVTFVGARRQVSRQLKDLYPDLPQTTTINYTSTGYYVAKKIFKALANMFNGAHDIQYWLGECGSRIATAVTPEQMHRIEAAMNGTLNEPSEFQKIPVKQKGEHGHKDELLSFKQSVIWTSPLKMPVVQPYREMNKDIVHTRFQTISLRNASFANPVDKRKQLQAFPPNFIHSLDATHMVLSALACEKRGLTFTAVHDSFWTHAADVDTMNEVLRDSFIAMHSEDIIGRLRAEFEIRYRDCMYVTSVKASSHVGKKIAKWRGKSALYRYQGSKLQEAQIKELLQERRRLKLLASEKAEERKEGEAMVTAYSIFEQSDGEADLAADEALEDVVLGGGSSARENKLQANEKLEVGDEDNIGSMGTTVDGGLGILGPSSDDVDVETEASEADVPTNTTATKKVQKFKVWLWRPLTIPPVPKKYFYVFLIFFSQPSVAFVGLYEKFGSRQEVFPCGLETRSNDMSTPPIKMAPTTTKQWTVTGRDGFDSLNFEEKAQIPQLGDRDVLVHFHYAALNYRDLIIPKGKYSFPAKDSVVPGSDGAGTVEAVGPRVTQFKPGDKVVTIFNQAHLAGPLNLDILNTGVGGVIDGTLRQYGAFEENGLVHMPTTLDFKQSSTLSCAAVTAWNALYGLESKALKPGETVLTQGTGGVSIFALQFAKAAGARVIATTSSDAKAETLRKLGADTVLNYKTDASWGESAKKASPHGLGVDHILEVGGPTSMAQSLQAIRPEGVISIIGFLGGSSKDQPSFLQALQNLCIVRGILVGSRLQFEQMNEAIDSCGIKPVVDEKVFALDELKDAYQYMWDQKHFGKLTVKIDESPKL